MKVEGTFKYKGLERVGYVAYSMEASGAGVERANRRLLEDEARVSRGQIMKGLLGHLSHLGFYSEEGSCHPLSPGPPAGVFLLSLLLPDMSSSCFKPVKLFPLHLG